MHPVSYGQFAVTILSLNKTRHFDGRILRLFSFVADGFTIRIFYFPHPKGDPL
jgi:hypothetical protein